MKKYNLYLWLAALVGLFASCSQDENAMLQTNESNRVSLTAELPDDFAQIGTRALPTVDGHKLRCILEVWAEGGTVLKHREEKINLNGNNVEFNFTIDAGTYNCLFWADFIETDPSEDKNAKIGEVTYTHYADKYYATNTENGLKAISIINTEYAAGFNTDARDAFFGNYELTKGAEAIKDPSIPSLTRPFAKLTIKEKNTTNYDDCNGLTAKYNVPKTFNVMEGTATDSYEASYSAAPAVGFSDYTLFSDYIFTNATSTTLGSVALTFTSPSGKTFQDVTIPAGIPLKRNFKTNASGNLITEASAPTDGVKMTVTMNADWAGNVEEVLDPKVGWYFNSDGTWTEQQTSDAIGIIFYVGGHSTDQSSYYGEKFENKAIQGYVVPLPDKLDKNTYQFWKIKGGLSTLSSNINDYLGYKNTATIKNTTDPRYNNSNFPAAYYAAETFETTVTAPANTSGWYLPSCQQGVDIIKNLPTHFTSTLLGSGGSWSMVTSTYFVENMMMNTGYYQNTRSTGGNSGDKTGSYVIPVLTFFDK